MNSAKENTLSTSFLYFHQMLFLAGNAVRHHPYFREVTPWVEEARFPCLPPLVCVSLSAWLFLPHPLERLWTCHHQQHFRCCHSYHYSIDYRCFERHMDDKWVVPTLIYYGMQIIHPNFFLASTCIILCIGISNDGSSWTTIATIGIALLGIGKGTRFWRGMDSRCHHFGSLFRETKFHRYRIPQSLPHP